ncbi:MAG TPA: FHA domain-containing protein [Candidatus Thermoplasmatota archaeon]|nr:FHA domain-containing protein [Candidatus Thermoplasmatota archaeon]
MEDRPYPGKPDYERLGQYMRALSVPTRILLLQMLQRPHTPAELRIPPFRRDPEFRRDRTLSRQTVAEHLRRLEQVGLVRSRATRRSGQRTVEYVVNSERLFAMVDDFRRLALIRSAALTNEDTDTEHGTMPAEPRPREAQVVPGPALVLVAGPYEGQAFALDGRGPWLVGRSPAAVVRLGFDPFVSASNAEVRREPDGFLLTSLASGRNGTTLNWRRIAPGLGVPLLAGDTIGVGRSLLVARQV